MPGEEEGKERRQDEEEDKETWRVRCEPREAWLRVRR